MYLDYYHVITRSSYLDSSTFFEERTCHDARGLKEVRLAETAPEALQTKGITNPSSDFLLQEVANCFVQVAITNRKQLIYILF